jgi:hypothetical protein
LIPPPRVNLDLEYGTDRLSRNDSNYESKLRNNPEKRRHQSRAMKLQFTSYFISIHFNITLSTICVVLNHEEPGFNFDRKMQLTWDI